MVNKLEVAWTLAVVALLAGVAAYSTVLLYHVDSLPGDPTEYVTVIGHQWEWEFCYPANGTCVNSSYDATTNTVTGGALWAPGGSVLQVNVTGADVVHSFNIPQLGIRIDAIPGRTNHLAFTIPSVTPGTRVLDPVYRVLRYLPRHDALLPRRDLGRLAGALSLLAARTGALPVGDALLEPRGRRPSGPPTRKGGVQWWESSVGGGNRPM